MKLSAYTDLRREAPRLALALLFQAEDEKQVLSFLLLFGLELDRITAQASEPMLALIRLKWWEDQLDANTSEAGRADEAGPLAQYLHHQIKQGYLSANEITTLLSGWGQAVQAGQTDMSENWAELVHLMAVKAGCTDTEPARRIGRALAKSRTGQRVGELASAKAIHQSCGRGGDFLICLAYLAAEAERRDLNTAPFLVFSLLRQVIFRPASR